jgi:S1-C subfamily serine protease
MKKTAIYSRSGKRQATAPNPKVVAPLPQPPQVEPPAAPQTTSSRWGMLRNLALVVSLVAMTVAALWYGWSLRKPPPPPMPSEAALKLIDAELRQSLLKRPLPSLVARAYERMLPSVVRVVGLNSTTDPSDGAPATPDGVGTGVVIIDNGTILTNLHVVRKAKRLKVMFSDGHESEASIISEDPANDLAILRARSIPDDLQAASLRNSNSLRPGDEVLTIGFPFGIGPSVSAGVVSGLGREYRSSDGQQTIGNLIQFDAVANPGNSGGPLVTLEGDVVGIVTAILNPAQQRVFIGIGFAVPIENATAGAGPSPF